MNTPCNNFDKLYTIYESQYKEAGAPLTSKMNRASSNFNVYDYVKITAPEDMAGFGEIVEIGKGKALVFPITVENVEDVAYAASDRLTDMKKWIPFENLEAIPDEDLFFPPELKHRHGFGDITHFFNRITDQWEEWDADAAHNYKYGERTGDWRAFAVDPKQGLS